MKRFLTHLMSLTWRETLRMAVNLFWVRVLRERRLRNVFGAHVMYVLMNKSWWLLLLFPVVGFGQSTRYTNNFCNSATVFVGDTLHYTIGRWDQRCFYERPSFNPSLWFKTTDDIKLQVGIYTSLNSWSDSPKIGEITWTSGSKPYVRLFDSLDTRDFIFPYLSFMIIPIKADSAIAIPIKADSAVVSISYTDAWWHGR